MWNRITIKIATIVKLAGPSLWKILQEYGISTKVINIIKDMYEDNKCCVRHDGEHSDWFQVKTGVRQGCIISPLLFLIVIDWVMRKATSDRPRGLVWSLTKRLEDGDFADDHYSYVPLTQGYPGKNR